MLLTELKRLQSVVGYDMKIASAIGYVHATCGRPAAAVREYSDHDPTQQVSAHIK